MRSSPTSRPRSRLEGSPSRVSRALEAVAETTSADLDVDGSYVAENSVWLPMEAEPLEATVDQEAGPGRGGTSGEATEGREREPTAALDAEPMPTDDESFIRQQLASDPTTPSGIDAENVRPASPSPAALDAGSKPVDGDTSIPYQPATDSAMPSESDDEEMRPGSPSLDSVLLPVLDPTPAVEADVTLVGWSGAPPATPAMPAALPTVDDSLLHHFIVPDAGVVDGLLLPPSARGGRNLQRLRGPDADSTEAPPQAALDFNRGQSIWAEADTVLRRDPAPQEDDIDISLLAGLAECDLTSLLRHLAISAPPDPSLAPPCSSPAFSIGEHASSPAADATSDFEPVLSPSPLSPIALVPDVTVEEVVEPRANAILDHVFGAVPGLATPPDIPLSPEDLDLVLTEADCVDQDEVESASLTDTAVSELDSPEEGAAPTSDPDPSPPQAQSPTPSTAQSPTPSAAREEPAHATPLAPPPRKNNNAPAVKPSAAPPPRRQLTATLGQPRPAAGRSVAPPTRQQPTIGSDPLRPVQPNASTTLRGAVPGRLLKRVAQEPARPQPALSGLARPGSAASSEGSRVSATSETASSQTSDRMMPPRTDKPPSSTKPVAPSAARSLAPAPSKLPARQLGPSTLQTRPAPRLPASSRLPTERSVGPSTSLPRSHQTTATARIAGAKPDPQPARRFQPLQTMRPAPAESTLARSRLTAPAAASSRPAIRSGPEARSAPPAAPSSRLPVNAAVRRPFAAGVKRPLSSSLSSSTSGAEPALAASTSANTRAPQRLQATQSVSTSAAEGQPQHVAVSAAPATSAPATAEALTTMAETKDHQESAAPVPKSSEPFTGGLPERRYYRSPSPIRPPPVLEPVPPAPPLDALAAARARAALFILRSPVKVAPVPPPREAPTPSPRPPPPAQATSSEETPPTVAPTPVPAPRVRRTKPKKPAPQLTDVQLKQLTHQNTTRNGAHFNTIEIKEQRMNCVRPPSPSSKIRRAGAAPTKEAARALREDRAKRRAKAMRESTDEARRASLKPLDDHFMAPGDEEGGYRSPAKEAPRSTMAALKASKEVKWDKRLLILVDDDGLASPAHVRDLRPRSILKDVELDGLGNVPEATQSFPTEISRAYVVVTKRIFLDDV